MKNCKIEKERDKAMSSKEYILCAAIWVNDKKRREHQPLGIEEGVVSCGHRHHNCFIMLYEMLRKKKMKSGLLIVQGFLTSKGRFVDRKVAGYIARRVKQTEDKGILFSELLY